MQFFWACTGLASTFAVLVLYVSLSGASGAPQEAAGAAIALCVAVIPYVFTRAIEGWQQATWRKRVLEELQLSRQDFKKGTESLFEQLDRVRANTASTANAAPQVSLASGMGYCPGCKKLRGLSTTHCLYCKSTEPATSS